MKNRSTGGSLVLILAICLSGGAVNLFTDPPTQTRYVPPLSSEASQRSEDQKAYDSCVAQANTITSPENVSQMPSSSNAGIAKATLAFFGLDSSALDTFTPEHWQAELQQAKDQQLAQCKQILTND